MNEVLKFCENAKKKIGGGGQGGSEKLKNLSFLNMQKKSWGVRVYVNKELKFLWARFQHCDFVVSYNTIFNISYRRGVFVFAFLKCCLIYCKQLRSCRNDQLS